MSDGPDYVPTGRDDLLARMAPAWAELEALLSGVPPAQLDREPPDGGWSAKDHLAHLTTWMRVTLARIAGDPEPPIFGLDAAAHRSSDEAALNAAAQRLHHHRPVAEVLADLRSTHARLLATAQQVEPAVLDRPTRPRWPERGPLIENVHANAVDHLRQHLAEVRTLLGRA